MGPAFHLVNFVVNWAFKLLTLPATKDLHFGSIFQTKVGSWKHQRSSTWDLCYPLAISRLDILPPSTSGKHTQKLCFLRWTLHKRLSPTWALVAMQNAFHSAVFPEASCKVITPTSFSPWFLHYRMMGDSSTIWPILLRRGPCLPSWWRSLGNCGRMVGYKPASTELQSISSMIQHLSKTNWGGWGMMLSNLAGEISLGLKIHALKAGDPQTKFNASQVTCQLPPLCITLY